VDRNFNERVVDDVIDQFMATAEYAGFLGGDTLSRTDSDKPEAEQLMDSTSVTGRASGATAKVFGEGRGTATSASDGAVQQSEIGGIMLPVAPGVFATLGAPFPLTSGEWEQMVKVLEAMKPALVYDEPEPEQASEDGGSID
jgi:hypothetical protein